MNQKPILLRYPAREKKIDILFMQPMQPVRIRIIAKSSFRLMRFDDSFMMFDLLVQFFHWIIMFLHASQVKS